MREEVRRGRKKRRRKKTDPLRTFKRGRKRDGGGKERRDGDEIYLRLRGLYRQIRSRLGPQRSFVDLSTAQCNTGNPNRLTRCPTRSTLVPVNIMFTLPQPRQNFRLSNDMCPQQRGRTAISQTTRILIPRGGHELYPLRLKASVALKR